jgi:hypothetical protein
MRARARRASTDMILLLGYLVSLVATFVTSATIICAFLIATAANKAPSHSHRSHLAQLNKHEAAKPRGIARVARPIAKDKSMTVFADAGRFPKAEELQKPSR